MVSLFLHSDRSPSRDPDRLLLTVVLQSISTTIVMVIAFATAGLLNFEAAIYLVLGDNIGTA